MTIIDVKRDIKIGSVKPYYIFTGPDVEIQRIYRHKLAECVDAIITPIESVEVVIQRIQQTPIIHKRRCYIVWNDSEFAKSETLWMWLKNRTDDNIIILNYQNVDKRSKFYKTFEPEITEFNHLSNDILIKYIQKKVSLSQHNCNQLIDSCDADYGRILLELDKIQNTIASDADSAFETLVREEVIYKSPKDMIFDWVDSVICGRVNKAFEQYAECERKGVAPLAMLSVLYVNAKQVLQVQDCMREQVNIEKSTGLTTYQIKRIKEKCGYFKVSELIYMLKRIRELEVGIKVGTIEDKTAIPLLMVDIL